MSLKTISIIDLSLALGCLISYFIYENAYNVLAAAIYLFFGLLMVILDGKE